MQIEHKVQESKFVGGDGGEEVVLEYMLAGNEVNFTHTFVPTKLRGKGYAERIVRRGLAWAQHKNLTITASCWYVAKFL
jgi:predicted GNAT family acetyltransferase|tara:strand:- start:31291 stop:31527 length:237 start_codon:yes stop_codon:yes gene_type:complete